MTEKLSEEELRKLRKLLEREEEDDWREYLSAQGGGLFI